MKKCSKCQIKKELQEFGKDSSRKDGHSYVCKPCNKKCREENIDRFKENDRRYYENNKEKVKLKAAEYRKNNKEKIELYRLNNKAKLKAYLEDNKELYRQKNKDFYKRNKDKSFARVAQRRAKKLNASPPWLTKEQIREMQDTYLWRQWLQDNTGDIYHVDHIVPLQGKRVSGLHVPWNLQIIEAKENLEKSNRY